jgi:copper chaperone CopZ
MENCPKCEETIRHEVEDWCPACGWHANQSDADARIASLTSALAASEAALEKERERALTWTELNDMHLAEKISLREQLAAAVARAERAEAEVRDYHEKMAGHPGMCCGQCVDAIDAALARVREVEAESEKMLDEWEKMYAGRECPKCRYHVTMNVSDDPPEMIAKRMESVTAAARAEAVREFAGWEAENHGGYFTTSDLLDDSARYLASRKEHGNG